MVVDASILVSGIADAGRPGIWCEEILSSGDLVAPELVLAETFNIFRRLEASGALQPGEAELAAEAAVSLDLQLLAFGPFAGRIWELRHNVTAYDGWYVAVAEALDAPLATLDRKLASAPGPRCSFRLPPVFD
jgi:predicted nucleic acid-binding protein